MNTKNQNKIFWESIAVKNLSEHSDDKFKLANFFKTDRNTVLFDLHETLKGRKTENGFVLTAPEFFWMKKVIDSNDSSIHTLEHNSRVIIINKNQPNFDISVQKADNIRKNIILNSNEISNLLLFMNQIIEKLKNCYDMIFEFSEKSYHRHTIT